MSEHYSSVSSNPTQLGQGYAKAVAQSFGYSEEELASIPADSNLGQLQASSPLPEASFTPDQLLLISSC